MGAYDLTGMAEADAGLIALFVEISLRYLLPYLPAGNMDIVSNL